MNKHVKTIITDNVALSEWCVEVDPQKDGKLVQEITIALKATMKENNLIYLTAPQIGYNRRIFCLRFGKNDYRTFINPMIENNVNMTFPRERCCSVPDKEFIMPRFSKVKVFYQTPLAKVEACVLNNAAAFLFQHALDHLNGILVEDIGLEIDELFNQASPEDQAEVLKMYAESLDLRHKDLVKCIEEDEELSELNDAIKFISGVKSGTVTLAVEKDTK